MIISHESREDYKKIGFQMLWASFVIFFLVTFVCYYQVFPFLSKGIFEDIALYFRRMFESVFVLKSILIFFSFSTILLYTSSDTIDRERKKEMFGFAILSSAFFVLLMVVEVFYRVNSIFAITIHSITYLSSIYCFLQWKKKADGDLKNDRRLEVEAEFEQQRELVETDISINIPYEYSYLGERFTSWINVVNPFRGTLVGGTPGSGKSYGIIDEYLRQEISKGFAMVMYDFKYPTLTHKLYNYYWWYQDKYKIIPTFHVVTFEHPEYSDRCNPVNADSLHTIADASENIRTLMYNINMNWKDQQGEFFSDSAMEYTTVELWFLKTMTKKYRYNVCTFPHLVALVSFESTELMFLILQEYIDLKAKMKSFAEALEKGAMEQLAGQVASAGVALSKVTSKEINYIMSGDDFTFDINDPLLPKIVCIGNSPQLKETYSPIIGLILSKAAKEMNKEGRCKSGFKVDEFPTTYIRGIDNLIETGRSNKVATLLGFQSLEQIKEGYGEISAKKMMSICGSQIMGQMMYEDAESVSSLIGKQKVVMRSHNYSQGEVSENQQVNMESIVPPERISQFSQGVFCGVIADDMKYLENNKIFYGKVLPPIALKNRENDIPLSKRRKFIDDDELEEKTKIYLKQNRMMLDKISSMLVQKTIVEWKKVFEIQNTYEKFNNYIMKEFKFSHEVEEIVEFLRLKDVFKDFIIRELDKEEKKYISQEEKTEAYIKKSKTSFDIETIKSKMGDWVREAVAFEAREVYLTNYTMEIYNDIYRIISLEILDLKIVDLLKTKEQRQTKQRVLSLLKKVLKNKKFNEEITIKRFQQIINLLEEDEE